MLLWCSEAVIAQLAARRSHNPKVVSSILTHRMLSHSLQMEIFTLCLRHRNLRTLRSAKIFELMRRRDWLPSQAAIAQLGERQTEDLKVPGSIPGLGITHLCYSELRALSLDTDSTELQVTWTSANKKTTRHKASRGFEPRSLDSESRVLAVTPRGRAGFVSQKICPGLPQTRIIAAQTIC